jgi:hypothetical protein
MEKYLIMTNNEIVTQWINKNLVNYLKKHPENQTEIEHIIDYLNSDDRPKRITFMSYDEAKNGALKWTKKLVKKAAHIIETEKDVEVVYKFQNGVKLVRLDSKAAYEREGYLMRHCVASYYNKQNLTIYSLRDQQNKPHCTIEVQKDGEIINQIKGKGNGPIHPKYIKYVLKCLKKIGYNVKLNEMSALGYASNLPDGMMEYLEKYFDGVQYIMMQNQKLFYKYSKLRRK